jgi:hypothetical protein
MRPAGDIFVIVSSQLQSLQLGDIVLIILTTTSGVGVIFIILPWL